MATATSFKQECPICEALVPIRDPKLIGKKIKCPKCEGTFVVKAPPEKDEEEDKDEEETKPAKKASNGKVTDKKPAGNGKVTDKKPAKPAAKKDKEDKDDDDSPKDKKKKKKDGKKLTAVGGGLAVAAVLALGVGCYFLFFKNSKPAAPKGGPTPPPGQQQAQNTNTTPTQPGSNTNTKPDEKKKEGDKTPAKTTEEKSDLVEPTNLLPRDATALFSVNVDKSLGGSGVKRSALQTPGGFNEGTFLGTFGFPLQRDDKDRGVVRVITAINGPANWVFSVLRTSHKVEKREFVKRFRMEEAKDRANGIYYILGRQFDSVGNFLFKANRPRETYGAYFVDDQTIIFADEAPLKKFLQDQKTAGKKASKGTYQNVKDELKALLEKVDSGDSPALICIVGDVDTVFGATRPILETVVKHGAQQLTPILSVATTVQPLMVEGGLDKRVKEAAANPGRVVNDVQEVVHSQTKNAAIALTAFTQDSLALSAALEVNDDKTAETWNTTFIKPVLDFWATSAGNASPMQPMGPMMGRTGTGGNSGSGKKSAPVIVTQSGRLLVATYTTPMKSEYNTYAAELGKALVQARGAADMASTAPRYHQLAAALKRYVEANNGQFPRGTAPRKDFDFRHAQDRISWMATLLPYLPGSSFSPSDIDVEKEWFTGNNLHVARMVVPQYVVRSAGSSFSTPYGAPLLSGEFGATHFVGMAGLGMDAAELKGGDNVGIFGYDRVTKLADIPNERQGQVIAIIQVPPEFPTPWIAGGGATVRGVSDDVKGCVMPFVCAVNKQGQRGTYAIMADSTVRFIPENIDPMIFRSMCVLKGKPIDKFDDLVPLVPNEEGAESTAAPIPSSVVEKPAEKPEDKPADKTNPDKTTTPNTGTTTPVKPMPGTNPMQPKPMPGTNPMQPKPMPATEPPKRTRTGG